MPEETRLDAIAIQLNKLTEAMTGTSRNCTETSNIKYTNINFVGCVPAEPERIQVFSFSLLRDGSLQNTPSTA